MMQEEALPVPGAGIKPPPVYVPPEFRDQFKITQGNVYEDGAMHFLTGLKNTVWTHYNTFTADAQALCAVFMLIFFAIRCYEMMTGDKKLEIMPLLRPFGLVMVILWWGTFVKVVAYPTDVIAAKTEAMVDNSMIPVNELRLQRAKLMLDVYDQLWTIQADAEIAHKEADTWYEKAWESVESGVKEGFATVWNPIIQTYNKLLVATDILIAKLAETISLWILRICVYLILLLQVIFSTVLVILGPFAVAISILPAFRDSFSTWVARFVSVNLYSGIAFLVMYIGSLFQQYALEAEITRYEALLNGSGDTAEKVMRYAYGGVLSFGTVIVVFLITGFTMLAVPSISTWIVSTSGVSSAVSTMGRSASSLEHKISHLLRKGR